MTIFDLALQPGLWSTHASTHARGQAHGVDGQLLRAPELAARFDALIEDEWPHHAASLNGSFAVVRSNSSSGVVGAVDRLRSMPLFYGHEREKVIVGDSASAVLARLGGRPVDAMSAAEFHLTGYTTGSHTLYAGLEQVPPGHCLFARHSEPVRLERYYAFRHADPVDAPESTLIGALASVHERVFRRLVRDTGERPLAIPLSGGYDSRLIGVMLRDLGCRDVLCFTYGLPGNWEARISRELALHLGFRWTMVPYSAERWRAWREAPEFKRYFHEAGNACSSPHFQDWPAVFELQARGELSSDTIFVPGHSGDFLAGSHVPAHLLGRRQLTRDEILRTIFDAHYTLWDWPATADDQLERILASRIEAVTGLIRPGTPEHAADVFEAWDCAERQAKFIVNSVRVYEAFGYEWRLPLFDAELMDFWSRIPLRLRSGRALYLAYVRERQSLPITGANTDRALPAAAALKILERAGLKPLAKCAQRLLRRARWRHAYAGGTIGWFALVEPAEFRRRYTGREIGHSFFADQYLDSVAR